MAMQRTVRRAGPPSIARGDVVVPALNGAGNGTPPTRGEEVVVRRSASRSALGSQEFVAPGLFDSIEGPHLQIVSHGSDRRLSNAELSIDVAASRSSARDHYRQTLDRFRHITKRADVAVHERESVLIEVVRVASTAGIAPADCARDLTLRPDQVSRLIATVGMLDRQPGEAATARRNHPERFSLSHLTPLLPLDAADQGALLAELGLWLVTVRELRRRSRLCLQTGGPPARSRGGRKPHPVTQVETLGGLRHLLRSVTAVAGTARHRPPAADGTQQIEVRVLLTMPALAPRVSAGL
jgi:hypothetical protein